MAGVIPNRKLIFWMRQLASSMEVFVKSSFIYLEKEIWNAIRKCGNA